MKTEPGKEVQPWQYTQIIADAIAYCREKIADGQGDGYTKPYDMALQIEVALTKHDLQIRRKRRKPKVSAG